MKLCRKVGSTSNILQVFIADSSSTTGAGLTGLTNASGSLTAYYNRDTDASPTVINLVTMTVGTFTSSGFKEISSANMPGWYQFCPPDAALATGAKSVGFHLKGAANMAPLPIEIDLDAQVDVTHLLGTAVSSPATAGVMDVNVKNINNVAAATPGAAGGLFIAGSNAATTISGLTTGALSCTTITASGAVAFQSTFAVTTSTSLAALSATTVTFSGAVAFQSTFAVTTSTSLAALSATTITASGTTSLAAVTTSGTVTFNAFTITNNMLVSGTTTHTGATTHTGNVSMAAGLTITQSTTNGHGITTTGNGTGHGILSTGGAATFAAAGGHGVSAVGGASSTGGGGTAGNGLNVLGGAGSASTNGAAVGAVFAGGGTNTVTSAAHGISTTGTSTGVGLNTGGLTTGAISSSTITASGAVAFQSTFAVTTSTSLGALSCSTLTASGAVAFQSTFAVTTSTSLAALSATTITASGTTSLAAVTTSGTVTLNAMTVTNALTVSGTTSLAAVSTSGTVTLNALTVTNAVLFSSTFTVSGAVLFSSTFATTGTTTFNALTITNAMTVSGATTLTGAVTASNVSNNIVGVALAANQHVIVDSGTVTTVSGNVTGSVGSISGVTFPTNFSALSIDASGRMDLGKILGTASAGAVGYVGIDWAHVNAPTTTVNLSGTTIATTQKVDIETIKTNPVVNAGTITFPTTATLASTANITAAAGCAVSSIGSNVITAASIATDAGTEIAAATWDLATSGHTTSGTFGAAMIAASSAGDPWATSLPGAYGAGTAGFILGTNLNATITSRSSLDAAGVRTAVGLGSANLDTQLNSIYVVAGLVQAQTDKLNFNGSGNVAASAGGTNFVHTLGQLWVLDGSGNAVASHTDITSLNNITTASIWDLATSGHTSAGSFGAAMAAAGAGGDPWITDLPGTYTAGQAGYIIGNQLNASITSRAAPGDAMALTSGERTSVATAWGSSVIGNGRTRDYFLQGGANKVDFAADGLSFTVYATDDTSTLYTGSATRFGSTIGGLRSVDPV